ncbi:hypothetical protein BCR33DRAFT_698841 [Rhizoclosmatium globosum]|uniref:Fatty acid hydroxylase domain-containing protein n=1 Tax=Rhizoclosmatium globosum TaxID=329046 RepID=A0A1Y2C491_9FUNG|nr:hypothetical protein BCR33DRAFT_698841 [Rhizoclosmatium globosum]|eukprot:ORY41839.1 hypothetical protein BCR33DRAFT_698841 [Rhizoclosmatium globosum]
MTTNPALLATYISFGHGLFLLAYTEVVFQFTNLLFKNNVIKRYHYPIPTTRHLSVNFINAVTFAFPSALYFFYNCDNVSYHFSWEVLLLIIPVTLVYMVMHDAAFYVLHPLSHRVKPFYNYLHASHHKATKHTNVFDVANTHWLETLSQVGTGWLLWTAVVLAIYPNVWLVVLPQTFGSFTTVIGHCGFKGHRYFLLLHPLAIPIAFLVGKYMLTVGDHLAHHVYPNVNYGLFFQFWDRSFGTYRKYTVEPLLMSEWKQFEKGEEQEE